MAMCKFQYGIAWRIFIKTSLKKLSKESGSVANGLPWPALKGLMGIFLNEQEVISHESIYMKCKYHKLWGNYNICELIYQMANHSTLHLSNFHNKNKESYRVRILYQMWRNNEYKNTKSSILVFNYLIYYKAMPYTTVNLLLCDSDNTSLCTGKLFVMVKQAHEAWQAQLKFHNTYFMRKDKNGNSEKLKNEIELRGNLLKICIKAWGLDYCTWRLESLVVPLNF